MTPSRRQLIGGAVSTIVGLSGCSALDSLDNDGSGGSIGGPETIVDDTQFIEEDEYLTYELFFDQDRTVNYEFTVRDGPNIDVFIVSRSHYRNYRDREEFRYYGETLDLSAGDDNLNLREDDYYLVLDNTDYVEASPPANLDNDTVEVDVKVTVE